MKLVIVKTATMQKHEALANAGVDAKALGLKPGGRVHADRKKREKRGYQKPRR